MADAIHLKTNGNVAHVGRHFYLLAHTLFLALNINDSKKAKFLKSKTIDMELNHMI